MSKIGVCFSHIADRKLPRRGAAAQASDLGEDEPHPVARLHSVAQFAQRLRINAGLGFDKTFERRHRAAVNSDPLFDTLPPSAC